MEGTITWFNIAAEQLPPALDMEKDFPCSTEVLILDPVFGVIKSKAIFNKKGVFIDWEHMDNLLHPTHWAYINYPES